MTIDQIPIGRFSVITRLSLKALRYYDERGILVPQAKDGVTGYRYYTGDQIHAATRIKVLTALGLTLDEAASLLSAEKRGDEVEERRVKTGALARIRSERQRLERVEAMLTDMEDSIKMTLTEPQVKEMPAIRVVSKRRKGPIGETIEALIGEVWKVIYAPENQQALVKMTGPIMCTYHSEEYGEEFDMEISIPVTGRVTVTDPDAELKTLPATRVLSAIHKGPYETIGEAYGQLYASLGKLNLKQAAPMRDLYLSDPNKTPPNEIMTEIQIPVHP